MLGAFIIKDPVHDPYYNIEERVLILQDWSHCSAEGLYASQLFGKNTCQYDSYLLNGVGQWENNTQYYSVHVAPLTQYRFRIINAASTNTLFFGIENHTMTIIAGARYPSLL